MPTFNSMMAAPVSIEEGVSGTNAQVVVTVSKPADDVRNTIAVYGVLVTLSAAPAATVAVLLKDGSTTILTLELPAATSGPVYVPFPANHPYVASNGSDVTLTVPALGSGVVGTGAVFYAYVTT